MTTEMAGAAVLVIGETGSHRSGGLSERYEGQDTAPMP